MADDRIEDADEGHENIERILKERDRLDRMLKDRFTRRMTIVFSDVSGYTQYMDTWGDIRGRAWIQKHHDIVFPLVKARGGEILDVMGDGLMIAFEEAHAAALAAIDMQQALAKYNKTAGEADEIHIHVGINAGELLVDGDHIAGDVVNVASRIQSQAVADEILISKSVYDEICSCDDLLCRYHSKVAVKGKRQEIELYRIVWKEEDAVVSMEGSTRGEPTAAGGIIVHPDRPVFRLDVSREEDRLKISAAEQRSGQTDTVSHYEEVQVPMDAINGRCRELVEILNRVNRSGRVTREILTKIRSMGQVFTDELFTPAVKDRISDTTAEHLVLTIDDQLVQVPWELFHDGRQFLCQRFCMGRLVRTRQDFAGARKTRALERPLRMLILADPGGDLKGAYNEGKQVIEAVDRFQTYINAALKADDITPADIKEKIRNFDMVHYAGHSDYDPSNPSQSGWRLSSGRLTAADIRKMAGTAAMPALIFSNACQSARSDEPTLAENFQDDIFGLANAFLLAGVKHYIGTFWEILDEPSSRFAVQFYTHLLSGQTVGAAVRQARLDLVRHYGEETIVWGSYLLYGDPTYNYMEQVRVLEYEEEPEEQPAEAARAEVRSQEEVIDFAEPPAKKRRTVLWTVAAVLALVLGVVLWGYPGLLREGTEKLEAAALSHFSQGNYEQALAACETLEKKNNDLRLPHLIRGKIALRQGNMEAAGAAFERAVNADKGPQAHKAQALVGLGRIASLRGKTDGALEYYRMAGQTDPGGGAGLVSQAMVLEQRGDFDTALSLLQQAQGSGGGTALSGIIRETQQKVDLAKDEEKQARIDRLVSELLEQMKSPARARPHDGWTSRPLTVWVIEPESDGQTLQEGESRLVAAGLTEQLIEHSRADVVERALLDKLLAELKLGTSELADRNTALALGKILAARAVVAGKIVHAGPQSQVSLRVIETETGRIAAAVNETFPAAAEPSVMADKLSDELMEKLEGQFPIRGKIVSVENGEITCNIGTRVGVSPGDRFKLADVDSVLEVISAGPDTCLAKVVKGEPDLFAGLRFEGAEN